MQHLSLEDIVEHFSLEDINLSRRQMVALISLFDPDTFDLSSMERDVKDYIVRHMFNKNQRERYHHKGTGYVFAEIVMSCIL